MCEVSLDRRVNQLKVIGEEVTGCPAKLIRSHYSELNVAGRTGRHSPYNWAMASRAPERVKKYSVAGNGAAPENSRAGKHSVREVCSPEVIGLHKTRRLAENGECKG